MSQPSHGTRTVPKEKKKAYVWVIAAVALVVFLGLFVLLAPLIRFLLHVNTKDESSIVQSRMKVAALALQFYRDDHGCFPQTENEAAYVQALSPYLMRPEYADVGSYFYLFARFPSGNGVALGLGARQRGPKRFEHTGSIVLYERLPRQGKWHVIRDEKEQLTPATVALQDFTP